MFARGSYFKVVGQLAVGFRAWQIVTNDLPEEVNCLFLSLGIAGDFS